MSLQDRIFKDGSGVVMFLYVRASVGNLFILSAQIKIHFIELGIFKDSRPKFIFQSVADTQRGNLFRSNMRREELK